MVEWLTRVCGSGVMGQGGKGREKVEYSSVRVRRPAVDVVAQKVHG